MKDNFPSIHREYLVEWLKENHVKPKARKMPSANEFKFTPQQDLLNISVETLKAVCWPAWDKIVSREYLQNRKIPDEKIKELWYVDNSQHLSNLSEKYADRVLGNDPRIVLPFFSESGELVGVSGRAINDSPLRYLTMKFLEDVPLIYNINRVDKTKTVYVTEGPIDSLFLPNSIAVGGSDFKKLDNSIKDNAIIIFDNEPRSKEIIKKLEEVIELGYKVVIWHSRRVNELKDINDMIMDGLSQTNVLDIINTSTFNGLSAKLKLTEYKKT